QEMDPAIVKAYFSIFRSIAEKRKFYVYACNRETKVLSDGVAVNFCEYGWSSRDQIIIDEPCPWHQFFYCLRPPFLKSYDGVHRHRLVQLAPA
ncbi:MAG: sugar O-methyltransferase, partial [Pseudomonadota bacterium]